MYLVTVLAFLMYKNPENRYFPLLLIHAKLASSLLSLALFLAHSHYLIYLANFVIDGIIGGAVLWMYLKRGSGEWAYS
jgi:ABC-type Co2+ transport system permease subunit